MSSFVTRTQTTPVTAAAERSSEAHNAAPDPATLIALGIDVGYGHTKFATAALQRGTGGIWQCPVRSFPSVAVARHGGNLRSDALLARSRSLLLDHGGHGYVVGLDAAQEDDGASARALDSNFTRTTEYELFVKAALLSANVADSLRTLVLGVPVNTPDAIEASLKARFTGVILANHRAITISAVKVVDQPVAAYLWHVMSRGQQSSIGERTVLVLDIGYRTIDWVVLRGLAPAASRSGSTAGGVMRPVQMLATELSRDTGIDCTSLAMRERIESALRQGSEHLLVESRAVELRSYADHLKRVAQTALAPVWNGIGNSADISDVLLVGGGGALYERHVCDALPNKRVQLVHEPQFAVARGLQLLAELKP